MNDDKTPTILPPPSVPPAVVEAPKAPVKPRPRGFAGMDRALVSEIARKGGKAAHEAGTAHEFTSEEAREAGRKGGKVSGDKKRAAKAGGPGGIDSGT